MSRRSGIRCARCGWWRGCGRSIGKAAGPRRRRSSGNACCCWSTGRLSTGVWAGDPWWLTAEILPGVLRLQLGRRTETEAGAAGGIGPLPASFRYRFGTLARCIYRLSRPELGMHQYPHGLAKQPVPLGLSLPLPDPGAAWELLAECALGKAERLLEKLDALAPPESLAWQEFWAEEREAAGEVRIVDPPSLKLRRTGC